MQKWFAIPGKARTVIQAPRSPSSSPSEKARRLGAWSSWPSADPPVVSPTEIGGEWGLQSGNNQHFNSASSASAGPTTDAVEPAPNALLTRNSFWPHVRDLTRYLRLGLNSACSSGEPQETTQSSQSQDIERRRRLKDSAAIAEGIEQDLSNAFIDQALAEAAHGESASLEGSRDNSGRPGGTDCTSWGCVPGTGDSAFS